MMDFRHSRVRWMFVAANLSLVAALLSWYFLRHGAGAHIWIDGVIGVLFGLSIGMNLTAVWRIRRAR